MLRRALGALTGRRTEPEKTEEDAPSAAVAPATAGAAAVQRTPAPQEGRISRRSAAASPPAAAPRPAPQVPTPPPDAPRSVTVEPETQAPLA